MSAATTTTTTAPVDAPTTTPLLSSDASTTTTSAARWAIPSATPSGAAQEAHQRSVGMITGLAATGVLLFAVLVLGGVSGPAGRGQILASEG